MSVADWIILGFLVFSVVAAAIEGFFREAFGLAGLIAGYLLAAGSIIAWRSGLRLI